MKTITMSLTEYENDIAEAKAAGKAEIFKQDLHTILMGIRNYHRDRAYPVDSYGHRLLEESSKLLEALNEWRKANEIFDRMYPK